MPRERKRPLGTPAYEKAQRVFTDREEPQESFLQALNDIDKKEYFILTYYGVGGIGKSALQRHLMREHLDKREDVIYSHIDFQNETMQKPSHAYRTLADRLKEKFGVKFPIFNIAYTIFFKKANPNIEATKATVPFLEESELASGALEFLNEQGGMTLGLLAGIIKYTFERFDTMTQSEDVKQELRDLQNLSEFAIEKELPRFFAYDLDRYKVNNPNKKVVIFIDTYEALWKKERKEANALTMDEWVRSFVIQNSHTLFVICGREKLQWIEDDSTWEDDIEQHIVGDLSSEDARYFLKHCKIEDKELQEAIITSSKGVPYYLDLCVETYERMQNSGKVPTKKSFEGIKQSKISERFLRYLERSEVATLKVLSVGNFFTKETFVLLIEHFKTAYPANELQSLANFSFIKQEKGRYLIHELMRQSLQDMQTQEEKEDTHKVLFDFYNKPLQKLDIKNIPSYMLEVLDEAFYHKEKLSNGEIESIKAWYNPLYDTLKQAGRAMGLQHTMEKILGLSQKSLGESHPSTATSYNNIASVYYSKGEYDKALEYYEKALKIREEVLGENHPDTAIAYNNIGSVYNSEGEYDKALGHYEKALKIHEEVLGENHPNTATSYNNIASVYYSKGEYDKALEYYEKALKICEEVLGENHPDTATTYNNIALVYYSKGEYDKALEYYEKALKICEEVLGENHPSTGAAYNNITLVYYSKGEYDKTLGYFEKALKIYEEVLGENHPNTAPIYNNIAGAYDSKGEYDKALGYYEKALKICKELLGENHPDTAITYNGIASAYYSRGEHDKVLGYFKKALKIREEVLGENHPDTATTYSNIAGAHNSKGEYDKALGYYEKALKIREEVLGENHPSTQTVQENYKHTKNKLEGKSSQHSNDTSYNEPFKTLLLLAKGAAMLKEDEEITLNHLVNALMFVELNEEAKSIFSQITEQIGADLNSLPKQSGSKELLASASSSEKLPYDETMKHLVKQLQEIFGDELICKFHDK